MNQPMASGQHVRGFGAWRRRLSGYSMHLQHFRSTKALGRSYPLAALPEHADRHAAAKRLLGNREHIEVEPLRFEREEDTACLPPYSGGYEFPQKYLCEFRNAFVFGGSNLFIHNKRTVCHELFNLETDYTAEEELQLIRVHSEPGRSVVSFSPRDLQYRHLPEAFSVLDALSINYCHWLTEILPRAALFREFMGRNGVPMLVDAALQDNMMESLLVVCGKEQEIIKLPYGHAAKVGKLHVVSCAGYMAFHERRGAESSGHSGTISGRIAQGTFSRQALEVMRRRILDAPAVCGTPATPKKLFLRRNGQYRNLVNAEELEDVLKKIGFTVIEPEKLSFSEQAAVFSRAEVVVSPAGAACANMIFCPAATPIVILIGRHAGSPYYYWQRIAAALGKSVRYVFGDTVPSRLGGMHADISIRAEDLLEVLE